MNGYDKTHAASSFWPVLDQGVAVNDLIHKELDYNTPNKKAPQSSVQMVEHPIVAEEPADWSNFYSAAGVVLAASLLIAAILWKTSGRLTGRPDLCQFARLHGWVVAASKLVARPGIDA